MQINPKLKNLCFLIERREKDENVLEVKVPGKKNKSKLK